MKKSTFIIIILVLIAGQINAQFAINYNKFGLKAGDTHISTKASYQNPGEAGENVQWDFSTLTCINKKVLTLEEVDDLAASSNFSGATVAVNDDGNYFFYQNDLIANDFKGHTTQNSIITYTTPIRKMSYPFSYKDYFEDRFVGNGLYNGSVHTDISGSYKVEADAFGTLILPNAVIKNALRVKAHTKTIEVGYCNWAKIETVKYLWYAPDERYPVLVIIDSKKEYSDREAVETKNAYYNENLGKKAASSLTSIERSLNYDYTYKTYPNPFVEKIKLEYKIPEKTEVAIQIFDENGRLIKQVLKKETQKKGNYNYTVKFNDQNIAAGNYFVKYTFGNKIYVDKIIKKEMR